ncbi:putative Membrane lipoprotein [Tripterygium wilfordii]|uniref:Putative Membrane lipoprotein n=1 Tax=Tripterygium wilfordii TaxID=458696 RepID=A0A7J7DGB2_TRIWF|nr:putative Membrane lipoprotein [Tripterygium wilfordii]
MASISSIPIHLHLLLLILLLVGPCAATRPGATMIVGPRVAGFRYQDQLFNFFPKGVPTPPSAPSKTHNSVVDSTPQNLTAYP